MDVFWVFDGLLQGGSLGSFSSDIYRLLQLCEEEDDATSSLTPPKSEPGIQKVDGGAAFQEVDTLLVILFLYFFGIFRSYA